MSGGRVAGAILLMVGGVLWLVLTGPCAWQGQAQSNGLSFVVLPVVAAGLGMIWAGTELLLEGRAGAAACLVLALGWAGFVAGVMTPYVAGNKYKDSAAFFTGIAVVFVVPSALLIGRAVSLFRGPKAKG